MGACRVHSTLFLTRVLLFLTFFANVSCYRARDCSTDGCANGVCIFNSGCVCNEGWYGDLCQYCGGRVRLQDTMGYIMNSPGGSNGTCSWLLEAKDSGRSIYLHIEHFASKCGSGTLYIHDGDSVFSPVIAVLTGVMYQREEGIARMPEVVAKSGFAYLHLTTHEDANNFDFKISFRMDSCFTTNVKLQCSGHGTCHKGKCHCEPMYTGSACDVEMCPRKCNYDRGICNKSSMQCQCKEGYKGEDCGQEVNRGVWEFESPYESNNATFEGAASHASVIWNKKIYLLTGGKQGNMKTIKSFSFISKTWKTIHAKGSKYPAARYAFSAALYGDKIYIYGGVREDGTISNELWAYDISSHYWDDITVQWEGECNHLCDPPSSTGHTAVVVKDNSEKEQMIIIFGYSPDLGYMNIVQQYDFGTRKWKIVDTLGFPVIGRYGHSSAWDELTKNIYVFGGYTINGVSSSTYSYNPSTQSWELLMSSPSPLVLHTASIVSAGIMIVYGGNSFTRSKCYSPEVIAYDIVCDTWNQLKILQKPAQADLARYGHSVLNYQGSMYIIGGFNGQTKPHMLKYTPGKCSSLKNMENCLSYQLGVKCVWNSEEMRCRKLHGTSTHRSYDNNSDSLALCMKETVYMSKSEGQKQCSQLRDCLSCTAQPSYNCVWCDDGTCNLRNCGNNFPISRNPESCPMSMNSRCERLSTCVSCSMDERCSWAGNKCEAANSLSSTATFGSCPRLCGTYTSCKECIGNDVCMWCESKQMCLERNSFFVTFPYGQCVSWTTDIKKCPVDEDASWCTSYSSCNTCISEPSCGWCSNKESADGSEGVCLPGGSREPITLNQHSCTTSRWHFTKCPVCQCNGHSSCIYGESTCRQPCKHYTWGNHCEKCMPGYFGNPVNGGQCFPCVCNDNTTNCHEDTGKCFCATKGVTGYFCDLCDVKSNYINDSDFRNTCFYNLSSNELFHIHLDENGENLHYSKMNFVTFLPDESDDTTLSVMCSNNAHMSVTVRTSSGSLRQIDKYEFALNGPQYMCNISTRGDSSRAIYVQLHSIQHPADVEVTLYGRNAGFPNSVLTVFFIFLAVIILLITGTVV